MFFKHVANKLRHEQSFDELANSSPVTDAHADSLPVFSLPGRFSTEPAAQAIVSPLEPDYIRRLVTAHGQPVQPPPLQPLAELAERSGAGYANLAGVLTATYPDMWREDLGRKVCVRYPNGDGWFNVVAGRCMFGATVDGMGGDGDDEAWLAAHMTLAVALRMMRAELPAVTNTREAAALLQRIVLQAHSEIMQLDVRGSTALLLHTCFHLRGDEYVFVFACTGDTEAYWFDSRRQEWRYLVEPLGPAANTLRLESKHVPGAIGRSAADEEGRLRRHTNLQYGAVACRGADMFLIGSDGVWDTLDAVQNGTPQHFGMPHETWDQLTPAEIRRTVPLVPIFKQRRLGEATKDAVATGSPQAVVDAVVKHAMQATRGERELFEIVDVESHGAASIYADTLEAKGIRDSLYADAKLNVRLLVVQRASEATGELIFAKPDHLGVQAFRPCAILDASTDAAGPLVGPEARPGSQTAAGSSMF